MSQGINSTIVSSISERYSWHKWFHEDNEGVHNLAPVEAKNRVSADKVGRQSFQIQEESCVPIFPMNDGCVLLRTIEKRSSSLSVEQIWRSYGYNRSLKYEGLTNVSSSSDSDRKLRHLDLVSNELYFNFETDTLIITYFTLH